MGSFLVQCGTSKQAINEDDKCYVAAITEQLSHVIIDPAVDQTVIHVANVDGCYIADSWSLASPYIECIYRDYGSFEPVDTPKNRLILASLLPLVKRRGREAVSVYDKDYEGRRHFKKEYDELVNEQWAKLDSTELLSSATIFPEMAKAWEKLNEMISQSYVIQSDRLFGYNARLALTVVDGYAYENLVDMGRNWVNHHKEPLLNSWNVADDFVAVLRQQPLTGQVAELNVAGLQYQCHEFFGRVCNRRRYGDIHEPFVNYAVNAFQEFTAGKITMPELRKIAIMITEDAAALFAMSLMQTPIVPLFTVGQDYDNESGQAYSLFVSRVCKKNAREGW